MPVKSVPFFTKASEFQQVKILHNIQDTNNISIYALQSLPPWNLNFSMRNLSTEACCKKVFKSSIL